MKLLVVIVIFVGIIAIAKSQIRYATKPGSCPPALPVQFCGRSCYIDEHCTGNGKCCPTRCGGSLCSMPVTMTQHTQTDKSGNCPMRNTVSNCGSRCIGDGECPSNQKCCPNKCGFTSCANISPVNTGNDGGYKGSSSTCSQCVIDQQAVYCNGVKCAAYEKCQYDRNTKCCSAEMGCPS